MLTKQQIEFRKTGLGGSDMGDLFSIEPYGCERKLFYIKRDIEPDFPFDWDGNPNVLRGRILEPVIRDLFAEKYNVVVNIPKQIRSKKHPFLVATMDGVYAKNNKEYVWEAKAPTAHNFKRHERLGLPESYILQIQTYLCVTEFKAGTFCFFNADLWKMIDFDVERDDELIAMIVDKAERFWIQVSNGPTPERLEQGDKRCKKCNYRLHCWQELYKDDGEPEGEESDYETLETEEFVNAFREHAESKELLGQAKEVFEESKTKLIDIIGSKEMVKCDLGKLQYKWQNANRLDTTKLKKDKPELYEEYTYKSGSNVFRFYPRKGRES